MNAPLPASTNWNERIAPDEEARFERYAEMLRSLQRARAKGKAARALHAKANVGCYGVLTIAADLPEPLRHGLFAAPRSHECFIRFSNGAGAHQSDTKPDVRGVAIKVLGVPGKKLIPGLEDATTQDFLLIRTSAMAFRSVDEFVAVVWASRSPALALPRLIGALGFSRTLGLLRVLAGSLSAPIASLATTRYFSSAPLRLGPYAMRLSLDPRQENSPGAKPGTSPDHLAQELGGRLAAGALCWELRAQLYVDEQRTPIEEPSVDWQESDAPYTTVATLTLPQQDLASAEARALAARIEELSFDPWHALEAHRPLGAIMRARNHAYRFSTQERSAAAEPEGAAVR